MAATPALAQTQGWDQIGQEGRRRAFPGPPLSGPPSGWHGPPQRLLVFIGIFSAMGLLTILEIRRPGGDERDGVLGLTTTRGDRLFISLLGTSYIFMAWLGLVGMPLWWPLALSIGWGVLHLLEGMNAALCPKGRTC